MSNHLKEAADVASVAIALEASNENLSDKKTLVSNMPFAVAGLFEEVIERIIETHGSFNIKEVVDELDRYAHVCN